jgi:Na+/H+ antiporter NhaD/arsenite permease-like protein
MPHSTAATYFEGLGSWGTFVSILPFAGLLLVIAVLPLVAQVSAWWEHHLNKLLVAVLGAASGVALYLLPTGDFVTVGHTYVEYLAFVALLSSLFMVSGGIHISGSYAGLPYVNTLFLGIGALLANLLGTTGASVLLIRPLLFANRVRRRKTHIVVFFIFVVANCGGLLTPLGDPPLYLGFLRGVPFDWTLRLLPQWALAVFVLLFAFFLVDERLFTQEDIATPGALVDEVARSERKLHIRGRRNFVWLAAIVGTILLSGYVVRPELARLGGSKLAEFGSKALQIVLMGIIAVISYRTTNRHIHRANEFTFAPMREVAVLFFGIFGAMIPALAILEHSGHRLGVTAPWQYFWASGILSSFLDNAPTYLTFATLAAAQQGVPTEELGMLAVRSPALLAAISCGSVFMGANTYIGNGPNFMIKSIAEHAGVKMPSFGGYMLWSLAVLIPVFLLETLIFFR